MKPKFKLTFRLTEIMLLIFELNLGLAGLAMVHSALFGPASRLYLPAHVLAGLMPAIMTVGFAGWLVYRYRCISQARHRGWGLLGATCLGFVALGFGAAIGKLNVVFFSEIHEAALNQAIADPVIKRAGLMSLLTFLGIGFVFGVTFIMRAARGPWTQETSMEDLHARINAIGAKVVKDWQEQLVPRIDQLLADDEVHKAQRVYREATGCSVDDASSVIGDWPEQRLRLELETLSSALHCESSKPEAVAVLS